MTEYVLIEYGGGLGNQYSQFLATCAYAKRHGKKAIFKLKDKSPGCTPRSTYFKTVFDKLEFGTLPEVNSSFKEKDGEHYAPIPELPGHVQLQGYFFSYKHYCPELETLKEELGLNEKVQITKAKYPELFEGPTASVHYRLGDYKPCYRNTYPSVLPPSYYHECYKKIPKTHTILYFCEAEDDEYIKQHYLGTEHKFVKVPNEIPDWEQMFLMASCDINVIANSSFSQWGALLGQQKYVMYPNTWFHRKVTDHEMFPESWIRVFFEL